MIKAIIKGTLLSYPLWFFLNKAVLFVPFSLCRALWNNENELHSGLGLFLVRKEQGAALLAFLMLIFPYCSDTVQNITESCPCLITLEHLQFLCMYVVSLRLKRHYPFISGAWILQGGAGGVALLELPSREQPPPAPISAHQLAPALYLTAWGPGPGSSESSQRASRLQSRAELLLAPSCFYYIPTLLQKSQAN